MAYSLTFTCNSGDGTILETQINWKNEIYVGIKHPSDENMLGIVLDKSTAIKFAKTLRTEINKIKD